MDERERITEENYLRETLSFIDERRAEYTAQLQRIEENRRSIMQEQREAGRDMVRDFDDVLALPWEYRTCLDMNGAVNMMKGAIETADLVTTVSETYAKELMYPYYAHGLDGVLSRAGGKLTGITNGIDVNTFNPETDPALPAHYNADTFRQGKAACKAALQREVGLPVIPDAPLMVMVTRLAGHKGLDLLCYAARRSHQNKYFHLNLIY